MLDSLLNRYQLCRFPGIIGLPLLETTIAPVFPDKPICAYHEIPKLTSSATMRTRNYPEFPYYLDENPQSSFGGMLWADGIVPRSGIIESGRVGFALVSNTGLIHHAESVIHVNDAQQASIHVRNALFASLFSIGFGLRFYEHSGYSGPVEWNISLKGIEDRVPNFIDMPNFISAKAPTKQIIGKEIHVSRMEYPFQVRETKNEFIKDFLREVLWSLGCQSDGYLNAFIHRNPVLEAI